MSKRIKIGDIIEIDTSNGNAYAQFTHKHPKYGSLIRVLPGVFETTLTSFESVINEEPQFITFFPLSAAVNKGIVKVVANFKVPKRALKFPIFKTGVPDNSGKVKIWWLWDGEKEWKVGILSNEQDHYPLRGIINDTLLVERIQNGWQHNYAYKC